MSINYKLSIATALAALALGSAAYASDASEIYGGDASGRNPATAFVGSIGTGYGYDAQGKVGVHHRYAHRKRRGLDAYGMAGGALPFPALNSTLSPSSLN